MCLLSLFRALQLFKQWQKVVDKKNAIVLPFLHIRTAFKRDCFNNRKVTSKGVGIKNEHIV